MTVKKKILIIDDDPDYVDGMRAILSKADHDVQIAYNPKDGFAALKENSYDLILLDIMMGRGAEGVMVARKLNDDPVLRSIPVLIVTGMREQMDFLFPGKGVDDRFLSAEGLLEKPVEPTLLLEKVDNLLKKSESKKEGVI